ncbi:replicative DNA helicase DnaB-like [Tenebrio molitor]|uniref:replicative DNA helicase DnaB-like n=1 Tax=Tenebrio molitor TaxID=7067 RepID=UPI003624A1BA
MKNNITHDLFHLCQDEWKWLETYYKKFRKTPTKAAYINNFPDFRIKAVDDTELYVEEVRRAHGRHELTSLIRDAADGIADGDIDSVMARMQSEVLAIGTAMGVVKDVDVIQDWSDIYDSAVTRQKNFKKGGLAGIPTGFSSLDSMTGGLQPGQLWVVAARLSEGKSWFLNQMATSAVLAGHNVHFAALEMQRDEVTFRIHNLMSKHMGDGAIFEAQGLTHGKDVDLKKYKAFLQGMSKSMTNKLTVSDVRGIGIGEIISQIERHQPRLYILDYLTLAKMANDGGWKDIGNFTKQLKDAAGRYGCTIVAAAQLNREGVGKEPASADALAESDSIGQDADAIITLKKKSNRVIKARLAKLRSGQGGYMWWNKFDTTSGDFHEITLDQAEDLMAKDVERAHALEASGGKTA